KSAIATPPARSAFSIVPIPPCHLIVIVRAACCGRLHRSCPHSRNRPRYVNHPILQSGRTPMTARTAIVTGASRGLGRAIALELAREGVAVVVAARSRDDLAEVAAEAERLGAPAALAVEADLRVAGEPERVVEAAV